MVRDFEVFEHTADTGVIAYGKDLKEAFINAARGMFSIITDINAIENLDSRKISITSSDRESLLVNWLNELIYLFDVDNLLLGKFEITHLDDTSLSAVAYGQKADPEIHELKTGIKAATYHMLEINGNDTCRVRILFDI